MSEIVKKITNKINNEYYERLNKKYEDFVDLSKTIKTFGKWITKWYFTSVDVTGIYHNEFNSKRYLLNCLHFVLLNICVWLVVLLVSNNSLWQSIKSDFWPRNLRIILITIAGSGFVIISFRFDALYDEWYNHLKMFKHIYYLQENISSKHGLTKRNHFKLSVLLKTVESLKILVSVFVGALFFLYLYIAIESNNLFLQLVFPIVIYGVSFVAATIVLVFFISFLSAYYYKLMFDQINDRIETIYKRPINSLSMVYQLRLIKLVKKHDVIANGMCQLSILVRRSALLYIIVVTLVEILYLNLFFDKDLLLYKIFYFVFLFAAFGFGFGFVFACSLQINAAHKPAKLIRKILCKNRKKFNFYFKWKVIEFSQ